MKVNYHRVLEETLAKLTASGVTPKLLLHSCCGPCSSSVLEALSAFFKITVLYYNPNIYPPSEFDKRAQTQQQLVSSLQSKNPIDLMISDYDPYEFDNAVAGFELEPEGGARCHRCFQLRLEETARLAKELGFDYFTTTLSVSPHKNAEALNTIGEACALMHGVGYLYADFKKKNGYKRSLELASHYSLYRQDYCGCRYSYAARHGETTD